MAGPRTHHTPFPEAWLAEQRRFWEAFAHASGHASLGTAAQAWSEACERWWQEVGQAVPEPFGRQIRAALLQTRLCMTLLHGASGDAEDTADPRVMLMAVMEAMRPPPGERPGPAEAACLRAWQAYVDALSTMVTAALARIRERLRDERPEGAADVYGIYAEELEARYREQAGSDDFARIVGGLINAQVDLLAARREPPP